MPAGVFGQPETLAIHHAPERPKAVALRLPPHSKIAALLHKPLMPTKSTWPIDASDFKQKLTKGTKAIERSQTMAFSSFLSLASVYLHLGASLAQAAWRPFEKPAR